MMTSKKKKKKKKGCFLILTPPMVFTFTIDRMAELATFLVESS